jgi:hypothetical protein
MASTPACAIAPRSPIDPRDRSQKRGTWLRLYRFRHFHALTRSAFVAFSCRLRRGPMADPSMLSLGAGCSSLHKLHNREKRGASRR